MKLLDLYMDRFEKLSRTSVSDGEGGKTTTWSVSGTFSAALRHDRNEIATQADGQTTESGYRLITESNIALAYPDVVRRVTDGAIFQITSDGKGRRTPVSAGIHLKSESCRSWRLPG